MAINLLGEGWEAVFYAYLNIRHVDIEGWGNKSFSGETLCRKDDENCFVPDIIFI